MGSIRLISLVLASAIVYGGELTLREALTRAGETAAGEEAQVQLAYGRLHYLESQKRTRFELRPQLGLLAFSNPLLLATNLGSGVLWQRFQAPGALTLRNAEFDVLASEVACARRRLDAKVEAARAFFELLELQEAESAAQELHRTWEAEHDRVSRLLKSSRITIQDKTVFDLALVELEMEASELEARRKAAAMELTRLAGRGQLADELRVTDQDLEGRFDYDALGREALVRLAVEQREELRLLRDKLESIPGESPANRKVRFDSFGANYAHINEDVGSRLGVNPQDFLLRGHTGRTELGVSISLRDTGEKAAAAEIAAARRKVIAVELEEAEKSIRAEVEQVWLMAAAGRRKLVLSAKRLALARQSLGAIRVRVDHGLGPITSVFAGELELLRQQSTYRSALSQQHARAIQLLVATGGGLEELARQGQ
jgi:outer membrane protein TolC